MSSCSGACRMDSIAAVRDSSAEPGSKAEVSFLSGGLKPNQVGETVLYGVPIVSLVIDGQERLCLAQISNTLLKHYSYNEIHNRRVALGITCVQCTPVQLEILRRAGAMPISSRRCGMITKREAERLCKSFLGAHAPPKLPENFAFDVSHECAWGSRGSFIPARYNSSRAKCIKCCYCNMYFSPNKFIFHSHRTPEAKYTQPDAANFNSWRRHLKLTDKNCQTEVQHAWEDVKAMFNGGSRKRTLPGSGSEAPLKPRSGQHDSPEIPAKILSEETRGVSTRSYPVIPVPSKGFGMLHKIPPPLFPPPYGFPAYGLCPKKDEGLEPRPALPGVLWPGAAKDSFPPFPVFWPLPPYSQPHGQALRNADVDAEHCSDRSTNTSKDSALADNDRCSSTQSTRNDDDKSEDEARPVAPLVPRKLSYVSAFRPVIKDTDCITRLYGTRGACRSGYLSPDFLSESSSYRSASPCVDSEGEADVDVETHKAAEDEEPRPLPSVCSRTPLGPQAPEHRQDSVPTEAHSKRLPLESHVIATSYAEVRGQRNNSVQCEHAAHTVAKSKDKENNKNKDKPRSPVISSVYCNFYCMISAFTPQVYTADRAELQRKSSPCQYRAASYHSAPLTNTHG